MKVWIDLSNSPHPLLFAPVVRRLEAEGVEVGITYRDHAQTAALTLERWPGASRVGGVSPGARLAKARGLGARVRSLARWARAHRPDVALSHNSYAQIVAARALGIPAVTAMDFEHQPANHLAFRAASRVLLPEALPLGAVRRQGASRRKVVRYPGLKEELYLADFAPTRGVLEELGIRRRNGEVIAVARTAPAGATYHRDDNPLLVETLRYLSAQEHVNSVVLARQPAQAREIEALGLPGCQVAKRALDTRSLMCEADVFIGAGGTMTREAALLGLPAYSIFAGRRPAVDAWLERAGLLRRLDEPAELGQVRPRAGRGANLAELGERGRRIEEIFVGTTLDLARGRR